MKVSEKLEHSTYISLSGAATSIIFVAINNTSFVATKVRLSLQNVCPNIILSRRKVFRDKNDTCDSYCQ